MNIPQSTVEKPLTYIDYVASMNEQCKSAADVVEFRLQVPYSVYFDKRFDAAVTLKLAELSGRKAVA